MNIETKRVTCSLSTIFLKMDSECWRNPAITLVREAICIPSISGQYTNAEDWPVVEVVLKNTVDVLEDLSRL